MTDTTQLEVAEKPKPAEAGEKSTQPQGTNKPNQSDSGDKPKAAEEADKQKPTAGPDKSDAADAGGKDSKKIVKSLVYVGSG